MRVPPKSLCGGVCDTVKLSAVQKQVAELSFEEKEGLLAFLIQEIPGPVLGTGDEEVLWREEERDSGAVAAISHEEFLRRVNIRHAFTGSRE